MRAMILAAGLGTRLRPLTDDRPKALVQVAGRTLLEIALARLRRIGINDVIVNAHHFADKIVDYLQSNQNFGMNIAVSREYTLLDTGGGLKKAAYFFLENNSHPADPIVVHNVDVISNIDIKRMLQFHLEHSALATLAVQDRITSRYLLFDDSGQLRGRQSNDDAQARVGPGPSQMRPLAFCGIHILSPTLLTQMGEEGAFSIITTYLRLATVGAKIIGFPADKYYWRDVGRPDNIAQATRDVEQKLISL